MGVTWAGSAEGVPVGVERKISLHYSSDQFSELLWGLSGAYLENCRGVAFWWRNPRPGSPAGPRPIPPGTLWELDACMSPNKCHLILGGIWGLLGGPMIGDAKWAKC